MERLVGVERGRCWASVMESFDNQWTTNGVKGVFWWSSFITRLPCPWDKERGRESEGWRSERKQLFLREGTFGAWWKYVRSHIWSEVWLAMSWWENLHRCVSTNLTTLRGSETNSSRAWETLYCLSAWYTNNIWLRAKKKKKLFQRVTTFTVLKFLTFYSTEKNIRFPADFVRLPTDKEMISLIVMVGLLNSERQNNNNKSRTTHLKKVINWFAF